MIEIHDGSITYQGKNILTPAKNPLCLPSQLWAEAIAEEWRAQIDKNKKLALDPKEMPKTQLSNSIIDNILPFMAERKQEIMEYARNDVVFYYPTNDPKLYEFLWQEWSDTLKFAQDFFGCAPKTQQGFTEIPEQPQLYTNRCHEFIADLDHWHGGLFYYGVVLCGSFLTVSRFTKGLINPVQAINQADAERIRLEKQWGEDPEGVAARTHAIKEFTLINSLLDCL